MRFHDYQVGDTITTTSFLWWPVSIWGERRWLERATIEWRYSPYFHTVFESDWKPVAFIDGEKP